MSAKLSNFGGILLLLVVGSIYLSTYIVDKTQYAIEILLGDPVDIVMEPGLNFKVPFVTRIIFMENRLQDYDADPGAVFTKDKKEMKVDTYSKWRVMDPLKFYETVRTTAGAHARLDDIIYSQTREVLGQHTLVEIVSGNRKEIREAITLRSRENAKNFGIEILDVRIKRADLPEQNSQAVFGRMNAERRRQAKLYRSQGDEASTESVSKLLLKQKRLTKKHVVKQMQTLQKYMLTPTRKTPISLSSCVHMMFIVTACRKVLHC